ncbi:MAG: FHA domain-containing protein [Polyangiales bacterium]
MSVPNLSHWKPVELLASARHQSLEGFINKCESPFLLLIKLEDPQGELALGLLSDEPREQNRDSLGFRTVQRSMSSVLESLEAQKRARDHTLTMRTAVEAVPQRPGTAAPTQGAGNVLPPEVLRESYHVLPLRKRSEAAFLRSVSVGRARNHDIVLRHRSVSKFHGSLDLDDGGRVFVRDANSSNHTFVNGRQISDRAEVHPGDAIQFGSVEAHLCTADALWRTLHG